MRRSFSESNLLKKVKESSKMKVDCDIREELKKSVEYGTILFMDNKELREKINQLQKEAVEKKNEFDYLLGKEKSSRQILEEDCSLLRKENLEFSEKNKNLSLENEDVRRELQLLNSNLNRVMHNNKSLRLERSESKSKIIVLKRRMSTASLPCMDMLRKNRDGDGDDSLISFPSISRNQSFSNIDEDVFQTPDMSIQNSPRKIINRRRTSLSEPPNITFQRNVNLFQGLTEQPTDVVKKEMKECKETYQHCSRSVYRSLSDFGAWISKKIELLKVQFSNAENIQVIEEITPGGDEKDKKIKDYEGLLSEMQERIFTLEDEISRKDKKYEVQIKQFLTMFDINKMYEVKQ